MDRLFIYKNKNGDIKVEELDDAHILEDDPLWEHIETVEPKAYLKNLLNKKVASSTGKQLDREPVSR